MYFCSAKALFGLQVARGEIYSEREIEDKRDDVVSWKMKRKKKKKRALV